MINRLEVVAVAAILLWDVVRRVLSCQGGVPIASWLVVLFVGGCVREMQTSVRGAVVGAVSLPCVAATLWTMSRTASEATQSLDLFAATAACGASSIANRLDDTSKSIGGVVGATAALATLRSKNWAVVVACCLVDAAVWKAVKAATENPADRYGEAVAASAIVAVYVVDGASRRDPAATLVWHGLLGVLVVVMVAARGGSAFGATGVAAVAAWWGFWARIGEDPVAWVLRLASDRLSTVAWWATTLAVSLPAIAASRAIGGVDRVAARKLFHLVAIALFAPAAASDPDFLAVAYGIALALFLWLEAVRFANLARPLTEFYELFLADDEGSVARAHVYLLFGCAVTHWLAALRGNDPRLRLAGLVVLGAGDAAAALVGRACGRTRWPRSPRTLEGSLAFVAATSLAFRCLTSTSPRLVFSHLRSSSLQYDPNFFFGPCARLALLEAGSSQTDNLFLPLFAFPAIASAL